MTSEDIVCFEERSGQPPWTDSLSAVSQDLEQLTRLVDQRVIKLEQSGGAIRISGTDRVGLVVLPSGRRLVIRSKIGNLVLLDWLAYLGEFPPIQTWLQQGGVATGDHFHSCLSRLFLGEIEKITRLHLRKDYMPMTAASPTIRGRILAAQLSQRLHRLPRVPQRNRSRTLDTKHNMVLAVTLDKLPSLPAKAEPNERKLLAGLRDLWANVGRDMPDPVATITESQWGIPPGYRLAMQLARLILVGAALDAGSRMGGQAFTLSLELIWERALRRLFHDAAEGTHWRCARDEASALSNF